jgi:hypothetical protein
MEVECKKVYTLKVKMEYIMLSCKKMEISFYIKEANLSHKTPYGALILIIKGKDHII